MDEIKQALRLLDTKGLFVIPLIVISEVLKKKVYYSYLCIYIN